MDSGMSRATLTSQDTQKARGFLSQLGGVYASPRETLAEIGTSPRVWVPLVVLLGISLIVGIYLAKTLDFESIVASQLERAVQEGRITREQMEQQVAVSSRFGGIQMLVGSLIGSLFMVFVIAGYGKLFSIFAGAENKFKPLLSVTIYVMLAVSIVQSGLMVLILQLRGAADVDLGNLNSIVASSLGALLTNLLGGDALPKFVMNLANAIDAFAIWTIALLAMGFSFASKKLKVSTAAFWLGGAYLIISVLLSFLRSLGGQ